MEASGSGAAAMGLFAVCAISTLGLIRRSAMLGRRHAKGLWTMAEVEEVTSPLVLSAKVVEGFGRGGKLLNCPTANMDEKAVAASLDEFGTGVYFGWAKLRGDVYMMVTSIGWNPYFKNERKTVEPHILHKFDKDFYGEMLSIIVCGKIRPEADFDSMEALVEAIENDKKIAEESLAQSKYLKYKELLP